MIRMTLRLPEDVHVRLAAQAEADRRSLNSEIVHLLEVALAGVEVGMGELPRGE
ncbi:Arc family DNA-binding protein [Streptomyces sp. NPDC056549]|uniref:Arc family DNA-binding protein n=1 Tax=Streptomyces sp. NPDC056549 TaxID=3345864 RepID=UPI00368F47EB